jgi:transposase
MMTADLLASCTPAERRVVTIVFLEGKSQATAARLLDCSRANISQTLGRALRKLREQAKLGLSAQNRAAKIKLLAERKAGELLATLERDKGGSGRFGSSDVGQAEPSDYAAALSESGTTRQDAHRWQRAKPVPPELLARYVEIIELAAIMCEAPDRIERDAADTSGRRAVDLGEPLGSRSGGRKRRCTRNNLDRWELEFVRDHGRPSGLWYHDHEALRLDEHGHRVARERRDYADRDGNRQTAPKRRPVNTQRLVRDTHTDAKDDHA